VIRDNSRAIRDNWRYGASHRQIPPILPKLVRHSWGGFIRRRRIYVPQASTALKPSVSASPAGNLSGKNLME